MQLALESCSLESTGRLLESVSNYRSRWMVIRFSCESSENDRIRLIGRLFFKQKLQRVMRLIWHNLLNGGLVVIGTWLIARSLLLSRGMNFHMT